MPSATAPGAASSAKTLASNDKTEPGQRLVKFAKVLSTFPVESAMRGLFLCLLAIAWLAFLDAPAGSADFKISGHPVYGPSGAGVRFTD